MKRHVKSLRRLGIALVLAAPLVASNCPDRTRQHRIGEKVSDSLEASKSRSRGIAIFVYVGGSLHWKLLVNYFNQPKSAVSRPGRAGFVALYWGSAMVGRFFGSLIERRESISLALHPPPEPHGFVSYWLRAESLSRINRTHRLLRQLGAVLVSQALCLPWLRFWLPFSIIAALRGGNVLPVPMPSSAFVPWPPHSSATPCRMGQPHVEHYPRRPVQLHHVPSIFTLASPNSDLTGDARLLVMAIVRRDYSGGQGAIADRLDSSTLFPPSHLLSLHVFYAFKAQARKVCELDPAKK